MKVTKGAGFPIQTALIDLILSLHYHWQHTGNHTALYGQGKKGWEGLSEGERKKGEWRARETE